METRTARLETRMRPSDKKFVEEAAAMQGVAVSDFSRDHLLAAASATHQRLGADARTVVPDEFFGELMSALDAPAKPNARATAAQHRLARVIPVAE